MALKKLKTTLLFGLAIQLSKEQTFNLRCCRRNL